MKKANKKFDKNIEIRGHESDMFEKKLIDWAFKEADKKEYKSIHGLRISCGGREVNISYTPSYDDSRYKEKHDKENSDIKIEAITAYQKLVELLNKYMKDSNIRIMWIDAKDFHIKESVGSSYVTYEIFATEIKGTSKRNLIFNKHFRYKLFHGYQRLTEIFEQYFEEHIKLGIIKKVKVKSVNNGSQWMGLGCKITIKCEVERGHMMFAPTYDRYFSEFFY